MARIATACALAVFWAGVTTVGATAPAPVCANAESNGNCVDESSPSHPTSLSECGFYLARSRKTGSWSAYTGRGYVAQETVGERDLLIPITDANKNEFSPWHDIVWDADLLPREQQAEHLHQLDHLWAGLGSLMTCAKRPNLKVNSDKDGVVFQALKNLKVGDELTMDCGTSQPDNNTIRGSSQSLEWIKANSICIDTLTIQPSTVNSAGRGAFAKQAAAKGDVVAVSPVVHFDRSQTEILQQERSVEDEPWLLREHKIRYTSHVVGQQKLLNYCYSHPQSNVMLLPIGPGVNFINHSSRRPNVQIRWSIFSDSETLRETLPVMELFEETVGDLVIEFVALTDIAEGDEILMDYGAEWEQAWNSRESEDSFRHEIGVPDGFYPQNWMKHDPTLYVPDFIATPLKPGYMAPVRWADTAEVVTPWAFRMGLDSKIRRVLLEYCDRMGITEMLRHVTVEGNGLEPGTDAHFELEGDDWFLQRPAASWRSNLHWLSPGAGPAHEHYLQALSVAGFDEVLKAIGEYLNMDGLVAFHVTFIAVSHSTKGYLHHDMDGTGRKMYNCIIPLILANETNPELDLQDLHPDLSEDDQEYRVGRYQYEYDVSGMMGDGAVHGTSAVDYRMNKEMRMAATVYITDVNEGNVDSLTNQYTQAYPPSDRELLLSWRGRHWRKDDPSVKLPEPEPNHILLRKDGVAAKQMRR